MGTSWISRKGGNLRKGGGVDIEMGGMALIMVYVYIYNIYITYVCIYIYTYVYVYIYICLYSVFRWIEKENIWVFQSAPVRQVRYKTIMGMSERACRIKIMHICIMNIHFSREFRC